MSSVPTSELADLLPSGGSYGYWKAAVHAFRALPLRPAPLNVGHITGPSMGAEPTFINMRGEILALHQTFHPTLWTGLEVPRELRRLIKRGMGCFTLSDCYDPGRRKWWNHNQMSLFIDRAGCRDQYLKGDLLNDWARISAELPRDWLRALRAPDPDPKAGDIRISNGTYYLVGKYGALAEVWLDVMGMPHKTGNTASMSAVGRLDPVVQWGAGIVGPADSTFPRPDGWTLDGELISLEDLTAQFVYRRHISVRTPRPACEENWGRYLHFHPPWDDIWASLKRPGIFTPHHYMTFFKVLHLSLIHI